MSGIYIKGMDMPKSCYVCPFNVFKICLINTLQEGKYSVTHSCPLVPVPDHGRLIDADALIADIQPTDEDANTGADLVLNVFLAVLKAEPTIIPADEDATTQSNTSNALDAFGKGDK